MQYISYVIAAFSLLGALDRIIGNKFGIGAEFERGLKFFGVSALSMIGMIVISPAIADLLSPAFDIIRDKIGIDPSIIPASIFANDMGGAPLSSEIASNEQMGFFNGLVVSSMMGCTISFTIPCALGIVKPEKQKSLLIGLLCGIITIPAGCFAGGLVCGIPLMPLLINLLPLVIFSTLIAVALFFKPNACVKLFGIFGKIINVIITIGLALSILRFLTGFELIKGLDTFESGAKVCLNSAVFMTGAFPMIFILSKVIANPMRAMGNKLGISGLSVMGMISSLATSYPTFDMMNGMDSKGIVYNGAFAVSGAFVFAGHLAFTLALNPDYVPAMVVGKLTAGILAVIVSEFVYRKIKIQ